MSFTGFKSKVKSKLAFNVYMLAKLPSAWFCGVRLKYFEEDKCMVTVPYKWLSQNPFHSIYFACQAMAAEFSTGLLATGYTYQHQPPVSMLVTGMKAEFYKKATDKVYFTCTDGLAISEVVNKAIATGEAQKFIAKSIGTSANGDLVSAFEIEWSFKLKQR